MDFSLTVTVIDFVLRHLVGPLQHLPRIPVTVCFRRHYNRYLDRCMASGKLIWRPETVAIATLTAINGNLRMVRF